MHSSRPTFEPSRFSSYTSASSSAASTPPLLSRAGSQTSLASDITTYSETSNDAKNTAKVTAKITAKAINPILEDTLESPPVQRVCFVGGGYVGGPTAAVMAYCNPNVIVTVVDMNEERTRGWQSKHLPIHEPCLVDIVRIARDGAGPKVDLTGNVSPAREPNLFFSTDCTKHIAMADIVFLSVNTPTKSNGLGAGYATDISMFESAARSVALVAKPGTVIVEKSTVPCRTARMVYDVLKFHRPDTPFEVLSNPEFLAEGTAIGDLLNPSRVLIGSSGTQSGLEAAAKLASVYSWVPRSSIVTVDLFSSELSKLVANAMLAQRVSSINSISAICEKVGADVNNVARTIGLDPRIGSKFLQAGLGFGGSCFKKDILSLSYLAETLDLPEVADYWRSVIRMNEWQCGRFVKSVIRELNGSLRGKKVAILGYAFKKDTGDTRESQAAEVVRLLQEECPLEIAIFDPQCSKSVIESELIGTSAGSRSTINVCKSPTEACDRASAVLILTEWDQFSYPAKDPLQNISKPQFQAQELLLPEPECAAGCTDCVAADAAERAATDSMDWAQIAGLMSAPRMVFDGRGVVDPAGLQKLGFRVEAIGKSSIKHFA